MKLRIAVIDRGFISPYFDEFFTILNRRPGREYVIFHGDPPRRTGLRAATGPFSFPNVKIRNLDLFKPAVYQPLATKVARGGFDAGMLGHYLQLPSQWVVVGMRGTQGSPANPWGFGCHA